MVQTVAEQDYLKQIYLLHQERGHASTQALAERLGVKPGSVSGMIKHLAGDPAGPLVRHTPYRGVELTERGLGVALEMLRHHRLIEQFLAELLDVPWDEVHIEAERLEHVLSETLEERIAVKLGHPTRDPHGDPIPGRNGTIEAHDGMPLSALAPGSGATVIRVPDGDAELLRYFSRIGLVPGAGLVMESVEPYGDVVTVRVDGRSSPLGGRVAQRVRVQPGRPGVADRMGAR
jgi:DtxR family transcriptional regulator, Mn-dependent transcriptional regulator